MAAHITAPLAAALLVGFTAGCAPATTCTWNSDCAAGKVCVGGACVVSPGPVVVKPNLLFLVARSASMARPLTPDDPACPAGCGPAGDGGTSCPNGCTTRLGSLTNSIPNFMLGRASRMRTGLALFPSNPVGGPWSACGVAGSELTVSLPEVDDEEVLRTTADSVSRRLHPVVLKLGGDSPLAAALHTLAAYPLLAPTVRNSAVVLITDGAPNCNAANPNTCSNATACRCTVNDCTAGTDQCTTGCLDADATFAAAKELQNRGVFLAVIGIGPDALTPDSLATLNAIAHQGGFALTCRNGTDAECGANNSCDPATRYCRREFFDKVDLVTLDAVFSVLTGIPR